MILQRGFRNCFEGGSGYFVVWKCVYKHERYRISFVKSAVMDDIHLEHKSCIRLSLLALSCPILEYNFSTLRSAII